VTELIGNGLAVGGGTLAIVALALTQLTGNLWPDTVASGLIGVALMAAAVTVTQKNRSLLTGQGVSPNVLDDMRAVIAAQPHVVDVPDLFAVVVGPGTLIVDGDVTFERRLDLRQVETTLDQAASNLMSCWGEIRYVYLTPVGERRQRGARREARPPT
jgi:divalent metal cation (Fe/Co/Zn/Cd) transporter